MSSHLLRITLAACVAFSVAQPVAHAAETTLSAGADTALQQAQTALAGHKYDPSTSAVNKVDAIKGNSEYDTYAIAQKRAPVALQNGNLAVAPASYDKLIVSPPTTKTA